MARPTGTPGRAWHWPNTGLTKEPASSWEGLWGHGLGSLWRAMDYMGRLEGKVAMAQCVFKVCLLLGVCPCIQALASLCGQQLTETEALSRYRALEPSRTPPTLPGRLCPSTGPRTWGHLPSQRGLGPPVGIVTPNTPPP